MTSDAQPSAEQSADPEPIQTSAPAQLAPQPEPRIATDSDAAPSTAETAAADDSAELTELQAQVGALKEQLAARDAALAEKDALIDSLRQQTVSQPPSGASGAAAPDPDGAGRAEAEAVYKHLLELKAEQTRADRTRDAAWAELKRCIEEVARLSNQAPQSELSPVKTDGADLRTAVQ